MADAAPVCDELDRLFLHRFPGQAARVLEQLDAELVCDIIAQFPASLLAPVFDALSLDTLDEVLAVMPLDVANEVIAAMAPARASAVLFRFDEQRRDAHLAGMPAAVALELRTLVDYPEDAAGRLMDSRVPSLPADQKVSDAITRIRRSQVGPIRYLFVVDAEQRPVGAVSLYGLLAADRGKLVGDLAEELVAAASALLPRDEVVEIVERSRVTEIPVVDFEGRYLGVIRAASLMALVREDSTTDLLTMVGASREERALSPTLFSVRKRLPWLQINLLTAFMAASVVGLFESTIAKFTALAVLLPVVAGQSGNSGSQALAVTMRGLALREISLRHWRGVMGKEFRAGVINGLAVALVCALGVIVWSQSFGLALVIAVAMVIAMVAAGCSGALIPILLRRFGQDPAAASSIILTTVTDIVGFFSFLGIATMLQGLL